MSVPLPPFSWHQLHPILVHFTAALVPVSVAADAVARAARRRSVAAAAWWTLLTAAVVTPLTAATGWWLLRAAQAAADAFPPPGPPEDPALLYHQWLGTALAVAFLGLCAWRGTIYRRDAQPGWPYLACGALLTLLTAYQGHLGGSLALG